MLTFSSGPVDLPMTLPPIRDPIAIERLDSIPPPREVALHRALGMLGAPYAGGSADPAIGFDCSGLTHWAYAQSGTILSRMSWGQWDETVRVEEPQPGDLVFFDTFGGVSHVGINIDGKTFIHATDYGKGVEITSYDEPYWSAALVGFGTVEESPVPGP